MVNREGQLLIETGPCIKCGNKRVFAEFGSLCLFMATVPCFYSFPWVALSAAMTQWDGTREEVVTVLLSGYSDFFVLHVV